MIVAAATYPIDRPRDFAAWRVKQAAWIAEGVAQGAELLVFPEYALIELAGLVEDIDPGNPIAEMRAADARVADAEEALAQLARANRVHILAGSGPVWGSGDRPVNRARLFAPDGRFGWQDKIIPTRFEREVLDLGSGGPLRLFETTLGRIGVLICYDAEFPLLARALVEAGAEVLLVPSATEAAAGYNRVRIGAMARALEGQCVVLHAVTAGHAPWSSIVGGSSGAAGVYGPPDCGFPDTGLLALGAMNRPGWIAAEVDLAAVARVRRDGRVLNLAHWAEQPAIPLPPVETCKLGAS